MMKHKTRVSETSINLRQNIIRDFNEFIVALSESKDYSNIMIITNRLSKDISLTALLNLEIEMIIQSFIKNVFLFHEASLAIVSN